MDLATYAGLARLGLPAPALYTLIGPAGSGKTTIAAAFPAPWRLSLDDCRAAVADDAGDQSATPDALTLFQTRLAARMARRLPTVVDATSTDRAHRAQLLHAARSQGMPTVAIVARTPLTTCLDRQADRPITRRVPPDVIAQQHRATPCLDTLRAEGYDHAHHATDIDWMRLLLTRVAKTPHDPHVLIRATFGPDIAACFTPDAYVGAEGVLHIAGRQLALRIAENVEPGDEHWQARATGACPICGDGLWTRVDGAYDLLEVHDGQTIDGPWCDTCDTHTTTSTTYAYEENPS